MKKCINKGIKMRGPVESLRKKLSVDASTILLVIPGNISQRAMCGKTVDQFLSKPLLLIKTTLKNLVCIILQRFCIHVISR